MGNGVHNCSNIIQNICNVDYNLNTTNATYCFNGYVDSWHKFCIFNATSCSLTLNELLAGHSPTYWAGWQNGKGDGKDGHFDIGGQLPVNSTFSQQQRFDIPLASRFRKFYLSKYTREQFVQIAVKVCSKLPRDTAEMIGEEVFKVDGSVRDVISISKLLKRYDGPEEVREILTTLNKYAEAEK